MGGKVKKVTDAKKFHPGGVWEIRSPRKANGSGHQAIYDKDGVLMMNIPSAGTVDRYSGTFGTLIKHYDHDVDTYNLAKKLNKIVDYYTVRPMPAKGK